MKMTEGFTYSTIMKKLPQKRGGPCNLNDIFVTHVELPRSPQSPPLEFLDCSDLTLVKCLKTSNTCKDKR